MARNLSTRSARLQVSRDLLQRGGAALLDVPRPHCLFTRAALFFLSSLLGLPLQATLRLGSSDDGDPDRDLASHVLEPLHLAVSKPPPRCPDAIDVLELERELAGRVVVPFGEPRPADPTIPGWVLPCSGPQWVESGH